MANSREKSRRPQEAKQSQSDEASNTFANDGSFLELFRKKMEQEAQFGQRRITDVGSDNARVVESPETVDPSRTGACGDSLSHDSRTTELDKEKKPVHKAVVGKRKAMMKSIELREKRKRRREELEEQQGVEDEANKSSAWKSYMAEVKSYEAQNCSDDSYKRPLVK